jgi:hypothetical protein
MMRRLLLTTQSSCDSQLRGIQGGIMWWGIGIGAGILYFLVAFTLGLMTLRNGHGWMFFFGIFFPVLWIIGAFMKPPETAAAV